MLNLRKNSGFTLIEMLIVLALIAVISLTIMSSMSTWIAFKQKLDNESKLSDIKQAFSTIYSLNALKVESNATRSFLEFEGQGVCPTTLAQIQKQESSFILYSTNFSATPQNISRDGYANPWCIYVSNPLSAVVDGTLLRYRNIAIVSKGRNGELDTTAVAGDPSITTFDPITGTLSVGGDDSGILVSGLDIQRDKLKETLSRMNKLATMYETYFTSRFLNNTGRDITKYYFSNKEDTASGSSIGGVIKSTDGIFAPVYNSADLTAGLAPLGVSAADAISAWGLNIEVGNCNETVNGYMAKTPFTSCGSVTVANAANNRGQLPFTAVLRTQIPSNSTTPEYVSKIVVGNY